MDFSHKTFTVQKGSNGWNENVGRFTDRINTIADGFLMNNKTHYPNGTRIQKMTYPCIAKELGRYCRAMGCKSPQERILALEELYHICDKADCGFTRKYWYTMGYGEKSTPTPTQEKKKGV